MYLLFMPVLGLIGGLIGLVSIRTRDGMILGLLIGLLSGFGIAQRKEQTMAPGIARLQQMQQEMYDNGLSTIHPD